MRITSQPIVEQSNQTQQTVTNTSTGVVQSNTTDGKVNIQESLQVDYEITREEVIAAVDSLNDFMEVSNYSSRFVFHDGLGKYFVQLIDPSNDEVIKEIPPKKLLDAFYEMQKMLGMIVDEKI